MILLLLFLWCSMTNCLFHCLGKISCSKQTLKRENKRIQPCWSLLLACRHLVRSYRISLFRQDCYGLDVEDSSPRVFLQESLSFRIVTLMYQRTFCFESTKPKKTRENALLTLPSKASLLLPKPGPVFACEISAGENYSIT